MRFNPEDGIDAGPRCRNCHRGSSGCGGCHNTDPTNIDAVSTTTASAAAESYYNGGMNRSAITDMFAVLFDQMNNDYGDAIQYFGDPDGAGPLNDGDPWSYPWIGNPDGGAQDAPGPYAPLTTYILTHTSNDYANQISIALSNDLTDTPTTTIEFNQSRSVDWTTNWRTSDATAAATCQDDGFSWPHRTLGWKMLKDDLFGLDFNGEPVAAGDTRTFVNGMNDEINTAMAGFTATAHDIDSVCLDCHNPTVWNASAPGDHVDGQADLNDNYDDELLLRGLP